MFSINKATDYRITLDETWVIKAIAIIAMLVHHLFYEHPEFGGTIVNIGMSGKICVALFVFLSGYGMATSFPKDIKGRFNSRVPLKITPKPLFTNKLTFTIFNLVTKRGFLYGPAQLFRPERQT